MSSPSNPNSTDSKHEIVIKDNITTFKILDTCVDEPPTENQKEKLLQFEEEFINRYTDEDEDFVITATIGLTTPPIVPSYRPFWNRKRDYRRKWEDRSDRNSYCHHKKRNYDYNNDFRR